MKYIIIVLAFLATSCNNQAEDAHAHNEDGSHVGEEIPRLSHTIWTDKTELFVEFPALIVSNGSKFAAHFTVLDKHQPVTEGSVTVSLIKDGKGIRNTVDAPSSPGIFSPAMIRRRISFMYSEFQCSLNVAGSNTSVFVPESASMYCR